MSYLQGACSNTFSWLLFLLTVVFLILNHRRYVTKVSREQEDKVRARTKELELQGAVVKNMAEGVCLVRASDGTIAYANPKFAAMFGYDYGELEGQHVSVVNAEGSGRNAGEVAAYIMGEIRRLGSYSYEVHNRKKDGTTFWCRATTSILDHPDFGPVFVAVQDDITDRKWNEEALKWSERRYREVIELASDGIFETGTDGKYSDVNAAACSMLGYDRSEIIGRSTLDLVAVKDRARLIETLNSFRDGGESQLITDFGVQRKDGSILPAEVSVKVLPDGRRISFLRDLTHRKKSEAALVESEKKYRSLVEGAYDSILVADSRGKIVLANEQLGRKFGYESGELIGQPIEVLLPERFRNQHVLNRGKFVGDARPRPMGMGLSLYGRRKDGSEFPVDISLSPTQTQEDVQVTAIIRDVTELRRAHQMAVLEKERAESAVKSREEVLGIVSHDLRNPLSAIVTATQLVLDVEPSRETVQEFGKKVQKSAKSMQRLIDDLLDFGKIQGGVFTVDRKPTEVGATINEALEAMSPRAVEKRIQLVVNLPKNCRAIFADKNRVVQVFWNLFGNAIKFTPAGGRVTLTVTGNETEVHFLISDTGPGIPKENLSQVFDRFWQARKSATLGSGLGLAIAKGIVEAHGGQIWADSTLGEGTQFHFTLPTAQEPLPIIQEKDVPCSNEVEPYISLSGIRVLVVDDTEENLILLRTMLEKAGARVTAAQTAAEALAKVTGERPDVMLTDIEMPGGDGIALVKEVHQMLDRRDHFPIAALTAHTSEREVKKISSAGFDACLSKPISGKKLVSSIYELAHRIVH